jgi:hypothetical protein
MSSEVDICNLALGSIGDTARVASISPPENSVQAQLCARFYPIARNTLLEMGSWGFATRRVKLALVTNPTVQGTNDFGTWLYAYALPSECINAIAVIPASAVADYEALWPCGDFYYQSRPAGTLPIPGVPAYIPQDFTIETQSDGTQIVLTNVCDAVLRFTVLITDTSKFSALFVLALSWLLASYLAGPILKGEPGAAAALRCLKMFQTFEGMAEESEANQRKITVTPAPSWIRGR